MIKIATIVRSRAAQVFGTIVGLAVVGMILRRALDDTEQLRFSMLPALGAVALFAGSWLGLSIAWTLLTLDQPRDRASLRWLRSQLLRYVPGGVWAPATRFAEMTQSRRLRAKLLLIETISILATATALGSIVAVAVLDARWALLSIAGLTTLAVAVAMAARIGRSAPVLAAWCTALALSLICYLLASALAQDAVAPGIPFWKAAAAGTLSWIAGYVVIVAPSGVGAKEWAYVWLLAEFDESTVAAGVIASRVLFIIGELLVLASMAAFVGHRSNPTRDMGSSARSEAESPY